MISQNLIKILNTKRHASLPDPFIFEDGSRVSSRDDWDKRKKELYHLAVEIPFGKQPPKPEYFHVEPLGIGSRTQSYRIYAGPVDFPINFNMFVFLPEGKKTHFPVVIDGDRCWDYSFNREFLDPFLSRGIGVVVFDRTELAADLRSSGHRSPIYRAYPDFDFGAISAWAWGYSRCVDALLQLDLADPDCIAFTGHSRGGKAALLAGVLDERATIVNPNESGCGGAGSYLIEMNGLTEDGDEKRNENLEDIIDQFDYWFCDSFKSYYGRAAELPFDQHELKALVAPRILLEGNAASDLWANSVGSVQTALAASEVFKFLGVPDNLYWYFRKGIHWHKPEDVERLAKLMIATINHEKTDDIYYVTPFPQPEPMFGWTMPNA